MNSASQVAGPIAPGEILLINGSNLADATITQCAQNGQLLTSCAGVSVLLNGKATPLAYVVASQVSFQAPMDLTGANATVQLTRLTGGKTLQSAVMTLAVAPTAPGLFTLSGAGGLTLGTFLGPSGLNIGAANPAHPDDLLTTYGTGFGVTNPLVASGVQNSIAAPVVAPVKLSVGGQDAAVSFAGLLPGISGPYQVSFKVPHTVPPGNAQVVVNVGGQDSAAVLLPVSAPLPAISGIVSAGAYGGFAVAAPGSWIEIYGAGLSATTRSWTSTDFTGINAPTSLDGVKVSVAGQAAFVDYVSPGQVNAQIPSNVTTGVVSVTVTSSGATSAPVNLTLNPQAPGLLAPPSFLIGGKQYVAAFFSDGSFVLPPGALPGVPSRQAKPGETILWYGIGFGAVLGPTNQNIPAGQVATVLNQLANPLRIQFGGLSANTAYAGLAPNYVGLYQFNVTVPAVADSDVVPLTFALDINQGKQTLYIPVKQ